MSIVKEMLKDKDIRDWYNELLYTGSETTAINYVRRLPSILKRMEVTPQTILKLSKKDLYQRMMNFAQEEKKREKAPSYIVTQFKPLYSYLKHKDVDFKRIPRPKNAHSTPTLKNELIPTKEELKKVFQVATPRDKVSISLMAFSGFRPGVIGNFRGNDGLRIGDMEGISIEDEKVIVTSPLMIKVREELSKNSFSYMTFLCQEGTEYLKNYLEMRIKKGEKLKPSSPVVRSNQKNQNFIGTNAIRTGIRKSFDKAGLPNRPYVLRRYFASMLLRGESQLKIPHSYGQFMMGHQGEMMDTYTLQKGLLIEDIDSIREAYRKCRTYLQTDVSQEEIDAQNTRLKQVETDNKALGNMLVERLTEQKKLQEDLEKKIKDLEMENFKLSSAKDEAKNETGKMKNELKNLMKAVIDIQKEMEKPPEYTEITEENMNELIGEE